MKAIGLALLALSSSLSAGCLDWAGAWERAKAKEKEQQPGQKTADALQRDLVKSMPVWTVRPEGDGIRAVPKSGTRGLSVKLTTSPASFDQAIRNQRTSLLDLYGIVSALEEKKEPSATENQVRDALIMYIRDKVGAPGCLATCAGNSTVCSDESSVSWGRGVPCAVGEDTPDTFTKKYGNAWCPGAFCQALHDLVD